MAISYNKLWKLMIDHNMNKTQLRQKAGLSSNVIAKMSKNDSVSMDTLVRICQIFSCEIGDIVEIVEESNQLRITGYPIGKGTNSLKVAEKSTVGYMVNNHKKF